MLADSNLFFGSYEDALSIARHDQHQFKIVRINYYTGNPFIRTSMTFNITFEDGTITMPYGGDFILSQQFESYVLETPDLFPLRFPVKIASREIRAMEKLAITSFFPWDEAYVNLRIYDGRTSMWFDSLNLPNPDRPYITRIIFTHWSNRNNHREIEAIVPFFGTNHPKYRLILTSYDIMAYVFLEWPYFTTTLLDVEDRTKYPRILHSWSSNVLVACLYCLIIYTTQFSTDIFTREGVVLR